MTYALSIIPDTYPGPDGKPVKVNKDDPNKFVIPVDDARRIVRAATRSAYAEVCNLQDLARANYQTLMKGEEAKKTWSQDQILLINALHLFSVSYFTGSAKITTEEEPAPTAKKPTNGAVPVSKGGEAAQPEATEPPAGETEIVSRNGRPARQAEGEGHQRHQRLCGGSQGDDAFGDHGGSGGPQAGSSGHQRLQLTLSVIRV